MNDSFNILEDDLLRFEDLFDISEIQKIQDAFADATGVASIITNVDGTPITRSSNFCRLCRDIIRKTDKGLHNCIKSDCILGRQNNGGPIMQPCLSGGLWDGGASISVGGKHIANWLIGQIRNDVQDETKMLNYAKEIGADIEDFKLALKEVTVMSSEQFKKICDFLFLMANQLSQLAYTNIQQKRAIQINEELQFKLNHKNKMDAIGQLAGGVAHDFNNILSGIMGASQLLKSSKRNLDEMSLEYVDLIMNAALRATDLTRKLLTFGRKGDRDFNNIDIHKVIDETVSILERTINKNISIITNNQATKSIVLGNISDLQNSFINLGINSSHAMINGGKLIFTTSNILIDKNFLNTNIFQIEPGNYIKISVRDTGSGISQENLDKIFEPFFTTKKQGKGTGLGLSIVYGVIETHHGAINVYSEIDIGTEFFIYLPLAKYGYETPYTDKKMDITPGTGKIFLIDDEDIIRVTGTAILKDLGYEVVTFKNPIDAVEHFRKEFRQVDLVITDMIMPEMSGRDVFYKLREIDPNCNVILSSGFTEDADLKKLLKDGLSGFISKPFTNLELSNLLNDIIGVKK